MDNSYKHLVVAVGGIGVCFAGQIIRTWSIEIGPGEFITAPFVTTSVVLTIAGLLCCVGAMLCQQDRYKKK